MTLTSADTSSSSATSADTSTSATTDATTTDATTTDATTTDATTTDATTTDATTTDATTTDATTTDGTTGDPVLPGRTESQLVNVGEHMSSATYQMVFTLGQPTQTQSSHTSANYRMQGGLIGANGSPP